MILVLVGYSGGNTYSCTVPDDCSPETNIAPATGGWKSNSLLRWPLFWGYDSFWDVLGGV